MRKCENEFMDLSESKTHQFHKPKSKLMILKIIGSFVPMLSIIHYSVTMAESGGRFSGHHHNMVVPMQVFHGSRFLHHASRDANDERRKQKKEKRMRLVAAAQGPMRVDSVSTQ